MGEEDTRDDEPIDVDEDEDTNTEGEVTDADVEDATVDPSYPSDEDPVPNENEHQSGPITVYGYEQYKATRVSDRRRRGRGYQYLVHWKGH